MATIGDYPRIEALTCVAEDPYPTTIKSGKDTIAVPMFSHEAVIEDIPVNCPRSWRYDDEQLPGCLTCSYRLIEFAGGKLEYAT